jgi:hypothetical protein
MKVATTPTVTVPRAASTPPVTATAAKPRLPITFMRGMRNPVQICERVPTRRRRSLMSANAPAQRASRPNAFTAWMPETVSSTWPFNAPRASCCCLNSMRVLREMIDVKRNTRGAGTSAAAASSGLRASMIATVPPTRTTLDSSCEVDCDTVTLIASTSLESRLMRSPCVLRSKNESGSRCSLANRPSRTLRTIRWDTPAMIQPSKVDSSAPPR